VKRLARGLRRLKHMHWPMAFALALLLGVGALFIYSACFVSEDLPVASTYRRHLMWTVAGAICYLAFAAYDYRKLARWSAWFYAAGLVLLLAVLVAGTERYGARRWLPVYGSLTIQPSEVAKLLTVLMLARLLSRPAAEVRRFRVLALCLAVAALPAGLILVEPSLGTALVFVPMAFAVMYVGGIPAKFLTGLAGLGLLAAAVMLAAVFLPERLGADEQTRQDALRMVGLRPYHRARIVTFLHPGEDPLNTGWNKLQSEIAVGSGGLWGKGFLKGTQNILGYLPRSVAPTDFIYSVIAEETGYAGTVTVLALFGAVLTFGLQAAVRAGDRLGRLFCVGAVTLIFTHVCVNVAMTVGLLPITGLPLPLLSYGGTFMVVTMSALGIVQSVYIHAPRVRRAW